jgi:curved DNA-binding protein CbpA
MIEPYELLGVSRDSDAAVIRLAYRRAAALWHPDRAPTKELQEEYTRKFQAIKEAYEILSDPERRRTVDFGGFSIASAETVAARASQESQGGPCPVCGGSGSVRIAGSRCPKTGKSLFWSTQPCPKGCKK